MSATPGCQMGHQRVAVTKSYRQVTIEPLGPQRRLHVVRAERALGRPLPLGACVHHVDGSRGDDSPLVICQDQSYHKLLHRRMRVKAAGGNPNTDALCSLCDRAKPSSEFSKDRTVAGGHKTCCNDCRNARRRRLE